MGSSKHHEYNSLVNGFINLGKHTDFVENVLIKLITTKK